MSGLFRRVLLWIVAFTTLAATAAEGAKPANKDERIQTLDQLIARIETIRQETHTPAVGFALVEHGRTEWVGSLGDAKVQPHVKANADTLYRIGSVSKMFVALSVLKLVEEGKLHLDDKLHDLAPDIAYQNRWEAAHPIRLVHLLEHTTGWDDMHMAEYSYAAPAHLSLKEGLAFHPDSRTSRWVPGTRMSYCNTGPVVAAYIVEKVTGMTFEDYVQANFFTPLGMGSTSYFATDAYQQRGATLYSNGKAEPYWSFYGRPAGSVNSSPADMAKFVHLLINRGAFDGQTLLKSASIDRMEAQTSSLGAAAGITSGYGLHNYVTGYKHYGVAFHGHNGGLPGALTELSYAPQLGAGYVVMINATNPALQQISDAVKSYLLRKRQPPKVQDVQLPSRFQAVNGYFRTISPRNETLKIVDDVFGIMKIAAHGKVLQREPLLGGWESPSADYAVGSNLLVNPWSGMPSIAFVNDPLAGESLAVDSSIYQPVSAFTVFGQLGLLILLAVMAGASLLFALVWIPRRLFGKLGGGSTIRVRAWPLATTLALAAIAGMVTVIGMDILTVGRVSAWTVCLFVASLVYPLCALRSLAVVYQARKEPINRWAFWSSAALATLHALFCILLASYGMIGYRAWA
ncbi:MAG: serine hydrolase domain-containing protein [Gammaproteobacteria bacterium]